MKDKIKLLGLIALAAVIGLSMTACPADAGGGGGDPDSAPARVAETVTYESKDSTGGVYVLVITENTTGRAAYTANPGDTYVLTYYPSLGGKKTTSGRVQAITNGTIILEAPTATITVTINSSEQMTAIASDTTWDDGSVIGGTPGTLTPVDVDPDLLISNGVLTKYTGNGTRVTIPHRVTAIGWIAFEGCTSLISVDIPTSVTEIRWSAFQGCSSLTSVTIPNSVTSIDGTAFQGCTSLISVTIPDSVTEIGWGTFFSCTSLASITIPNSVTSIGNSAFEECSSLTSVTIPNSVTSIGAVAFQECSLTSVTIPSSVTSIGYQAFFPCTNLVSVTFQGTIDAAKLGSNNEWDNSFTSPFAGDLRDKYLAPGGGIGTYTAVTPVTDPVWTKS